MGGRWRSETEWELEWTRSAFGLACDRLLGRIRHPVPCPALPQLIPRIPLFIHRFRSRAWLSAWLTYIVAPYLPLRLVPILIFALLSSFLLPFGAFLDFGVR